MENIYWQCTTDSQRWVDKGILTTTQDNSDTPLYINVDQTVRYQLLDEDVWGGCFNERGWKAMANLTDVERKDILKNLFGDEGLKLTVGRTPIAASDYSIAPYSYNENSKDYSMEKFSIEQDYKYLIPYIKTAMDIKPNIKLWASPWSPPSWLKENNSLIGGYIKDDAESFKAYARYFSKYVKAYRNEGLNIYMIMPQNEPTMNTAYTSCVWSGEQLKIFIKDYLAPILKNEGVDVDIWLGTFTDSDSSRVDPTLNDPVAVSIIKGVAFQWWGAPKASVINRQKTGLKLMQSETKCGDGKNDWTYAENQFDLFKEYFEAGVNSYMLWNMVLDQTGANTTGSWYQNAAIIVRSDTNEVIYTPQYYQFKHFSHYIKPGAGRIKTDGNYLDRIAFQNPDGENILVVKNGADSELTVAININGEIITPTIESHSINTFRALGNVVAEQDSTPEFSQESIETAIKLINVKNNKALSVVDTSFDDAKLVLTNNTGTAEQIWTIDVIAGGLCKLINKNSLKAIDVIECSSENEYSIVQRNLDNGFNQRWKLVPVIFNKKAYYMLKNFRYESYLSAEGSFSENQLNAVLSPYAGSEEQLWEAVIITGGDALK